MSGIAWSQQEETFLRENYYNKGPHACALSLDRSYESVKKRANGILGLFTYRRSSCNESFFKDWTLPNSYCFGLLTSDGCMHEVKENSHKVSLDMTDRDVVDIFAQYTDAKVRVQKRDGRKDIFRIGMHGAKVIELLYQKGLRPQKSCKEVWPSISTKENIWYFLRGCFDGDGCVSRHGKGLQVRFFAGKSFLEHLKFFLESEGVKIASILKVRGLQYNLSICCQSSLKRLYEKMYANSSNLRMGRKYERFKSYFGEIGV